jgi:molybdopterin biosynthesis enzyme
MKGKIAKEEVIVLHSQESYKMDSFVESDCLIQLEEGRHTYKRGEKVKVHPID